jgi:hypothetical protein
MSLVLATLILAPLTLFLMIDFEEPNGIKIDGKFNDWDDVQSHYDSTDDQVIPDLNIHEYKIAQTENTLSFYVRVKGQMFDDIFETPSTAKDNSGTLRIFLDTDTNPQTGYLFEGLGADKLIEIDGYEGAVRNAVLKEFNPLARLVDSEHPKRPNNDWNAWDNPHSINAICNDNKLETQIHIPDLEEVNTRVHLMDSNNNFDMSDVIVGNSPGSLLITQQPTPLIVEQPDLLTDGEIPGMLELELQAYGEDILVDEVGFNHDAELYDDEDNEIVFPLLIKQSEPMTVLASPKLSPAVTNGEVVDFEIKSAVTDSGPVTISGNGAKAYVGDVPPEIRIDGLFEDWVTIDKVIDEDKHEVANPNVDISSYSIFETPSDISFYFKVEGSVLTGTELPVKPYIYRPSFPSLKIDSVSSGTDKDLPLDLPIKTGEDSLYIFLDTDSNPTTGYRPMEQFPLGADYVLELTGQNGKIINKQLLEFTGDTPDLYEWSAVTDLDAACYAAELEAQLELRYISVDKLGPEMDIYIHIVDWSGDEDTALVSDMESNNQISDELMVTKFQTRMAADMDFQTYNDAELTIVDNKFKHDDMVYLTVSDGLNSDGVKVATISNDDLGSEAEIEIKVYDDGSHYDKIANDGIYTGSFRIQSLNSGGKTDDHMDIIAVEDAVKIDSDLSIYFGPAIEPLHSPEFSDILVILPMVLILILITLIRRRRW